MTAPVSSRRRTIWFSLAAMVAAAVALVFATVGDGVTVPEATGARALVIDIGHTLVWVLLAVAFALAAVRGKWWRLPHVLAVTGGAIYALFLVAVFLWP